MDQASVSQGRVCTDHSNWCHTEVQGWTRQVYLRDGSAQTTAPGATLRYRGGPGRGPVVQCLSAEPETQGSNLTLPHKVGPVSQVGPVRWDQSVRWDQ